MTLSPEILTAIKAACAAKAKSVVEAGKLAIAAYFKWLCDAPVSESSEELEEALRNPEFMREAVKTRESTALCLTLANKGQTIPQGLALEAAVEAKAFGFTGGFKAVMEAIQAIQSVPSRFGYMALSVITENEQLKKNFLDLEMQENTALFYFTKPTAADKLKTECERVLSPLGAVETLVSPGDVIGEGVTSDLFVFAVTPTEAQQESIMAALIDGLVEAAIADTFEDVSTEALAGLMNEAVQFLNQEQEDESAAADSAEQPEAKKDEPAAETPAQA